MQKKIDGKFQRKLSELEKFIESVLAKPMASDVKRKIIDDLNKYKARLIAGKFCDPKSILENQDFLKTPRKESP